jgi:type IV pilus assembly protein PilV
MNQRTDFALIAAKNRQQGMTMIELLIAMVVLAVGMGGMLAVFAAAISSNAKAKSDTSGTMLAQTVLERIAAQPATSAANITMQDCNPGGAVNWTIATAPGGAATVPANPSSSQSSAGLVAGDIDWVGQTYAQVLGTGNYAMQFMACGTNGRAQPYEVRWNVQTITANARLITVSARPAAASNAVAGSQNSTSKIPITLRSVGGI